MITHFTVKEEREREKEKSPENNTQNNNPFQKVWPWIRLNRLRRSPQILRWLWLTFLSVVDSFHMAASPSGWNWTQTKESSKHSSPDYHRGRTVNLPCMSTREVIRRAPLLDCKRLRAVAPVELFKAIHRNTGCARHKLKNSGTHFGIEW